MMLWRGMQGAEMNECIFIFTHQQFGELYFPEMTRIRPSEERFGSHADQFECSP